MKSFLYRSTSLLALTFALVLTASAQQQNATALGLFSNIEPITLFEANDEVFPLVTEYQSMPESERSAAWWDALEQEISLESQSYKSLPVVSLQNLIFFQANHADMLDLRSSVPTLVDIYFYNNSESMRIMALAALIEIGDEDSLAEVKHNLYRQRTERVRDFSILALNTYYSEKNS